MATRPFANDTAGPVPADGASAATGRINHHELTVVAAGLADLVPFAGGWLFDRARAGWTVNVLVGERVETRALEILGVTALARDSGTVLRDVCPGGALAVSADAVRVDAGVRAHVMELVKRGTAEVTVWGDQWPAELGEPNEPTEYRLSVAARAFKARALAATKLQQRDVAATETLFELRADALRPLYPV